MRSTNNENPVELELRKLLTVFFQTLWGYRQKIFRDTGDFEKSLFFCGRFWWFFLGFIVFSFTLEHNFPYPKIYFLGVGWLWLVSKNHCGGPLKSNIAMVTKFPVLQQLHWYMAAFFRQVKIGVLTLTLEKKQ